MLEARNTYDTSGSGESEIMIQACVLCGKQDELDSEVNSDCGMFTHPAHKTCIQDKRIIELEDENSRLRVSIRDMINGVYDER